MAIKIDKIAIQMRIRSKLQITLDDLLGEQLYKHCFITGEDAWNYRYSYCSISQFEDENIYCGRVRVKAKKKYSKILKDSEFLYSFHARMKGRYDIDIKFHHTKENVAE